MAVTALLAQTDIASEAVSAAATAAGSFKTASLVTGITGFIPQVLGLVAAGVGIRKIVSWFRKGLKAL